MEREEILRLTAVELGKKIAEGETTSVEATKAYLDQIGAREKEIHAYITIDTEGALRQAEEADRRMYAMTKKILRTNGYERYEFSNYCQPGFECKHNLVYWTGGEYIGIGLGAASLFKGERFSNLRDLDRYLEQMEEGEYVNIDAPENKEMSYTDKEKIEEILGTVISTDFWNPWYNYNNNNAQYSAQVYLKDDKLRYESSYYTFLKGKVPDFVVKDTN